MEDEKALARGKYEIKKEELQKLKDVLREQSSKICETLRSASDSPTAAYINNKREMIEDVMTVGAPLESHVDQLPNKVESFIETVRKYQEVNKEAVSLRRQAGK